MSTTRIGSADRLRRGIRVAMAAALVSAGVAGASAAAAATSGTITTIGGGVGGPGRASQVSLRRACGVTYGAGSVYVADGEVRKINPQTDGLTTPADNGSSGPFRGDGDPAAKASLGACGVAVDHAGNLVIADAASYRVR